LAVPPKESARSHCARTGEIAGLLMRRAIGRNTEDPIGLPHFPAGPGRGREWAVAYSLGLN